MNSYSKFAWTTTPLALVLLCAVLYIIFDINFVRCDDNNNKGCDAIDANMISRVENAEGHNTSNSRLVNINNAVNNLSNNLEKGNKEIADIQANIAEKDWEIDCLKVAEVYANQNANIPPNTNCVAANKGVNTNAAANSNAITNNTVANAKPESEKTINANIKRLEILETQKNDELTSKQKNANALTADIAKYTGDALAIRKQYAGRYSNRMLWIFLTALFMALSIAAVIAAAHVIFKSKRLFVKFKPEANRQKAEETADKNTIIWLILTAILAVIVSIFVAYYSKEFMSIALPMLQQSILNENVNEMSASTLLFFTIVGFVGSIFLVAASCAIFRTAVEVKDETKKTIITLATPTTAETTETVEDPDAELKTYAALLKYLRTILYVGTFMLFVGIMRMSFMMKWHLSFISTKPDDPLYLLLSGFWDSSMSVQGGFYTILLAVIYLPAAFWINGKISQLGKTQAELTAEGVSVKYTDIIIRLLAIVSPLIASGFSGKEWLNFFGN